MIPLYVLIGVWGGPGRLAATVKFVVYTLAGSLLMLVSIIALGLSRGSFDLGLRQAGTRARGSSSGFLRLSPSRRLWPFHGWLPDAWRAPPRSPRCSRASSRRRPPTAHPRHPALPDRRGRLARARPRLASIGLIYGSLLAFRAPTSAA